jgi:protein disulfide-isomerase A6
MVLLSMMCIADAMYSAKSAVLDGTEANFKSEVLKHPGVVIVEFYAPWCGHCKNLVPEYEKAAKILDGVVKVVAVDATQAESLAQKYGIKGFPTIKVFGADKKSPVDYEGERTGDAIVTHAMKSASALVRDRKKGKTSSSSSSSSSDGGSKKEKKSGGSGSGGKAVIELTEDNFKALVMESEDHWLVEFYAPWCGHCKNLAPEWEEAAKQLKGSVKLGAVDATAHGALAQKYGVKGYPTIKVFGAGKKKKAADYNGPREAAGIVAHALQTLDAAGVPPSITEVTSDAVFDDKCGETGRICVVMFVPHILDSQAKGRNAYLDTLGSVAKDLRGKPLTFLWSEAGAQTGLEETLDVAYNYPTVAVLSAEKKASATMKISWSGKNVKSFVDGVLGGQEKIQPMRGGALPALNKVKKWDGKDGELVSDEIPLDQLFDDGEL